jgi:predicted DNA-binding transcriptional regulator YafY
MKFSKYDRLLYILNLLRSRRNLNAASLARECGVTERTIYRDIVSLSEANVPIYYDNGYKYASGNFLPPLNFDIDEYLTLVKALETSPLAQAGQSRKLIKSIRSKIEAVLSPTVKKQKLYRRSATDIKIRTTHSERFSEEYLSLLEKGILNNEVVRLSYDSIDSGRTDRAVEPYFLIFTERAFYLVGYCHLRRELRTFRVDRILFLELTGDKFIPRKNIDPQDYFEDSWGIFKGEPIEVEILFTGRAARIVRLGRHHPKEKVTIQKDGRVKYAVKVNGHQEIARWIMGFGGEARVLKPVSLIRRIMKLSEDIRGNYR